MVQEEKSNLFYKRDQATQAPMSIYLNHIVPSQLQAARLATQ